MTLHVSTHLDAPAHFMTGGKFIGDLPLDFLIGPACVVDLERMGVGDYELYGPEHFERWEKDTGKRIERGDILVIHTGYHRHYPENWTDRSQLDETKYFIRHPGPARKFAEWVLDRGVRWIAVDIQLLGDNDKELLTELVASQFRIVFQRDNVLIAHRIAPGPNPVAP